MNGRTVSVVILVLLLIAGAIGIGAYVYNVGMAQGLAESGKLVAPAPGVVPYPYYGSYFYHGPFGFGFGFLGCLFPLLFLLLFFGLLRGFFWRGRWGWGGHYGWREQGVPPMFEEWHKRAHEPRNQADK